MSVEWTSPPSSIELPRRTVHVWRIALNKAQEEVDTYESLLSEREISRADRYLFAKQRRNFIIMRGSLRQLCHQYTGDAPEDIEFEYNSYGKPFLPEHELHFCTAHSDNIGLFAFACESILGIEIRHWDPELNIDETVHEKFSAAEKLQYHKVKNDDKHAAFYKALVCKEAFLKAHGRGQTVEMNEFDVLVDPEKAPKLLAIEDDAKLAKAWKLYSLPLGTQIYAALAVNNSFPPELFQL